MGKIKVDSHWLYEVKSGCFEYYEETYIEEEKMYELKPSIRIGMRKAHKLVEFMREEGHLPKNVDEDIRKDDLKITHRHLDIIEKMVDSYFSSPLKIKEN